VEVGVIIIRSFSIVVSLISTIISPMLESSDQIDQWLFETNGSALFLIVIIFIPSTHKFYNCLGKKLCSFQPKNESAKTKFYIEFDFNKF